MNSEYIKLVDYAEALVYIVNKKYLSGNNMAYLPLLSGLSPFKVSVTDAGVHNYQAVVDAVNNCYAKNPESKINEGYEVGIHMFIKVATRIETLQSVFNILFYQLKLEKTGIAKFSIDAECIVNQLNDMIHKYVSQYKSSYAAYDSWIERNQSYAFDNFGLKIDSK